MSVNENLKKTLLAYKANPTLMAKDPLPSLENVCVGLEIKNTSLYMLKKAGYGSGSLLNYDTDGLKEMRKDIGLPHYDMMRIIWWKQARQDFYSSNPVYMPTPLDAPVVQNMIGHIGGRNISENNGNYTNNRKTYGNVTLGDNWSGIPACQPINSSTVRNAPFNVQKNTVRGDRMTITKPYTTYIGDYGKICKGAHHCHIIGDYNDVHGHNAGIDGDYNKIYVDAHHSKIDGDYNTIFASDCIMDGDYNKTRAGGSLINTSASGTTTYGTTTYGGHQMVVHDMKGNRIIMTAGRVITSDGDVLEGHGNTIINSSRGTYVEGSDNYGAVIGTSNGVLSVGHPSRSRGSIMATNISIGRYHGDLNLGETCTNMTFSGTNGITFTWISNGKINIIHDTSGMTSVNGIPIDTYKATLVPQNVVVEKKDVVMKPAHFLDAIKGIKDKKWIMGDGREEECVICKDNRRNVALKPCGHLHTCAGCTRTLIKCPICRVKIVDTGVVFK